MSVGTRFVLSLTAVGATGLGVWMAPGCQPAETAGPAAITISDDAGPTVEGGIAYCGAAGATCCGQTGAPKLPAGAFPNPKCDDGDETQCGTSTSCSIAPICGSTAATSCEPLADNSGQTTQSFRMRRLILVAPSTLANSTVQQGVIDNGVDMNEPECGEEETGDFSWLLSFDTTNNTLKTGGAPPCDFSDAGGTPSCDPFTTGYCFVNKTISSPGGNIQVGPVTVATMKAADGTIQTAPIPSLNIPIYFQGSIIVLPIQGGSLAGVSITDNGNCIGSVNINALSAACDDQYTGCSKWLTAGALTGYITLNEANNVQVLSLGSTLCSLLTSPPDTSGPKQPGPGGAMLSSCQTANGNVVDKGNYCSKLPDGGSGPATATCADSVWLAATFAASAVHINDGTGVADCTGGGSPPSDDAGSDSGTDAGDSGIADAGPG
jgi:hypothetical protein